MTDQHRYMPPIIGALVVAILPHLTRLPFWVIAWCAVMWGYMLLSLHSGWYRPGKWLSGTLTITGLTGVFLTYNSYRFGPDAFLGLLAVMAAIKPFETRSHRDRMIVVFLAYFIVITGLFQSETLLMTVYMVISVFITTATLVRINRISGNYRADLKQAGRIVGQAIPLMVVLFLVFPRIEGSFFNLSRLNMAHTGFSDVLRPGSVTRLAENTAVAFRATFDDPIPAKNMLYWRGIVFDRFDGRQWHAAEGVPLLWHHPEGEASVSYSINLEPHNRHWLFALDLPRTSPRWANLRADYTLRAYRPVRRAVNYRMTSVTDYRARSPRETIDKYRLLPPQGNPLARELAVRVAGNAQSVEEKVDRLMAFFRNRDFTYTLQPPPLGDNPIDTFVTRTRSGYCEHYASAFAYMMRALDVPARVVGGYLGGEINPYGNYLVVRQSNAHAWVEVWEKNLGWKRVDPTTAVAPERVSGDTGDNQARDTAINSLDSMIRIVQLRWDAVSTAWQKWFTGYSFEQQQALLKRLGLAVGTWAGTLKLLAAALILVILFTAGFAVYFFITTETRRNDAVARGYRKFLRKLSRRGIEKRPAQGPADFAREVCRKRPDLAETVDEITRLYIRLRFEKMKQGNALSRFRKAVGNFRP